MHIRRVTPKEVRRLQRLIRGIISRTLYYSPEARKGEVEFFTLRRLLFRARSRAHVSLVAFIEKKVAGFSIATIGSGVLHLEWIGVDAAFRRRGVAEALVVENEKKAIARHLHKVWLDTRTNNKESIALFKKMGYVRVATLTNHWYTHDFYIWEKVIESR